MDTWSDHGELLANLLEGQSMRSLKEQMDVDGYIVVEGMFSKTEVEVMKQEIRKIVQQVAEENPANNFHNGVYVGLAKRSEKFRQVAADPRIGNVLKEAVGDNIIFLSDKIVAKDAAKDFASPWHQDWSYWYGSHKYSVWIALDDATVENGCLKIVPGTHRDEIQHDDHSSAVEGFVNRINDSMIDESKVLTMEAKAGTAIIFHDLLFHASYQNTSGKDRWALISTYKDGNEPDPEYGWQYPIKL